MDNSVCDLCQKTFSSTSTRNKHRRNVHKKFMAEKKSHLLCPLCAEKNKDHFSCHEALKDHITNIHNINIKESVLCFRSLKEFEDWRMLDNREVNYACHRRVKNHKRGEYIYYNCNRSDSKGYSSVSKIRNVKTGGSIRISGICPSRILVKILENGTVTVKFTETHVGHEDELRTKRLTKSQQEAIVAKLKAGVTSDRILQDARRVENNKLERINKITRGDLAYLVRKFNIDKKRDEDDKIENQEELNHYLKTNNGSQTEGTSFEELREVMQKEIFQFTHTADNEELKSVIDHIRKLKNN